MDNIVNNQQELKMDKNIYDPEKAKRYLKLSYGCGVICFGFLLLMFYIGGLSEVSEMIWLEMLCVVFLVYSLNGYLVMKDTNTVFAETEISGSPIRTFFFWKPENIIIKFSDIIDVRYKIEWGAKDINKFGVGFVNIKSKKGQYKFVCCNPGRLRMYILHKKKVMTLL